MRIIYKTKVDIVEVGEEPTSKLQYSEPYKIIKTCQDGFSGLCWLSEHDDIEKIIKYNPEREPIGYDIFNYSIYEDAYGLAGDILLNEVAHNPRQNTPIIQSLVYPLLFLYRQSIELKLKHIITFYCNVKVENKHLLDVLFEILKKELKKRSISVEGMDFQSLEKFFVEFSKIDPRGLNFRYDKDEEQTLLEPLIEEIDLSGLLVLNLKVRNFLNAIEDQLDWYNSNSGDV